MILVIKRIMRRLKTSDIEVYCNQTEIPLHSRNAKEILMDYYDYIADLPVAANISQAIEEDDEEYSYQGDGYDLQNLETRQYLNYYYPRDSRKYEEEYEIRPFKQRRETYYQEERPPMKYNSDQRLESHQNGNYNDRNRKEVQQKKPANELFEEVSSIKFESNGQKNQESFHSIENVITEDLQDNEAIKKDTETGQNSNEVLFQESSKEKSESTNNKVGIVRTLRKQRQKAAKNIKEETFPKVEETLNLSISDP